MSGEPADQPEEERNKRRRTSSPDGRNDLVPFKLAMDQVATTLSSVFASDLRELRENTDKKILEQRRIVEEEADVKYKKLEADSQELVRSKVDAELDKAIAEMVNKNAEINDLKQKLAAIPEAAVVSVEKARADKLRRELDILFSDACIKEIDMIRLDANLEAAKEEIRQLKIHHSEDVQEIRQLKIVIYELDKKHKAACEELEHMRFAMKLNHFDTHEMVHYAWRLAWCASVVEQDRRADREKIARSGSASVDSDSQFVFTFTTPNPISCQYFNRRVRALELGTSDDQVQYAVAYVDTTKGLLGRLELFDLVQAYNRVAPEDSKLQNLKCFTMDEIDKTPLFTRIWMDRLQKPVKYGSVWVNSRK